MRALPLLLLVARVYGLAFDAPAWASLQRHLDTLPVFTCVNAEGEPLGYVRDKQQIAIFFADVTRAKQELTQMSTQYPDLNLRLLGVGLGDAFRKHTEGSALLVPAADALANAGDAWSSEMLPLYTCLALASQAPAEAKLELAAGATTTPLFLCPNDAQASLDAALDASRKGGASEEQLSQLQLVVTSLPAAVELVLTGKEAETCNRPEGHRFQFVAPRTSLTYLYEQQQAAVGAKRRFVAGNVGPGAAGGGDSGLFPS